MRILLCLMIVIILLGTFSPAKADEMPPLYIEYFLPNIEKGGD
jgi:hypothetical protein